MRDTRKFKSLPHALRLAETARALRKAGMLHEVLLWKRLKKGQLNGLDFDRQKVIGHYIVDFFCAEKGVVIELDGSSHDVREEYDLARHEFLESLGLIVLRFSASAVLRDLDGLMEVLENHPALSGTPPVEGN